MERGGEGGVGGEVGGCGGGVERGWKGGKKVEGGAVEVLALGESAGGAWGRGVGGVEELEG